MEVDGREPAFVYHDITVNGVIANNVRQRDSQPFNIGPIEFLILANILMYILTLVRPDLVNPEPFVSEQGRLEIRSTLALVPGTFTERPWTLLTSMFVHAGLWHVFANMFTLYFFGRIVFRLVGEGRFLLIYFLGGILGGLSYVFLFPSSFSWAVGASGAVFALAGVLTVLMPRLTVMVFPIPAPIPLWVAVLGGFVVMSFFPRVAWEAHLGGLVFGMGIAYFYLKKQRFF